jgi:hypothetical protein
MPKKPTVALRKPPAVDPAVEERFVAGTPAPALAPASTPPLKKAPKASTKTPKARVASALTPRRRSLIIRADGRELRRTTVYLTPELRRKLAVYAAEQDTDLSAAIVAICDDFFGRQDGK